MTTTAAATTATGFLHDVPLESLPAVTRATVTVAAADPVEKTLKTLLEASIYSAPVEDGGRCVGLVDLEDYLAYLMSLFYRKAGVTGGQGPQTLQALNKAEFSSEDLLDVQLQFERAATRDLMNFSGGNPYHPMPAAGTTLGAVVQVLASGAARRVPILDAAGHVQRIVSPAGVVHWMARNSGRIRRLDEHSIKAAGAGTATVATIEPERRTIDAFGLMAELKISGLAFIKEHQLVGVITPKDTAGVIANWKTIVIAVAEFIKIQRQAELDDHFPTIEINENDSLLKAAQKLAVVGVHRLYLVDAAGKSVGVLSVGDVLRAAAKLYASA